MADATRCVCVCGGDDFVFYTKIPKTNSLKEVIVSYGLNFIRKLRTAPGDRPNTFFLTRVQYNDVYFLKVALTLCAYRPIIKQSLFDPCSHCLLCKSPQTAAGAHKSGS